jgi:hypothetical protein
MAAADPYVSGLGREAALSGRRFLLRSILGLGLLALATAGFFWQILFTGAWMPAGGGDLAALLYPTYHFAARSLKSGVLPLWNPYLWGGAPFAADIQAGFFYPVNLLYFRLAPEVTFRGVMLLAVCHVWLAGAGMFLYLRSLLAGDRLPAPLFGALAFMLSDYFVVHFGNLNLIAQAAWLPFVFLFYHRALRRRRLAPAAWAGVCLAVAASAGHIQPLLFIALGLAWDLVYQVGASLAGSRTGGEVGALKRLLRASAFPAAALAIVLAVGLGLSAPVWLPAYEMAAYTARADYHYGQATGYSLAPAQLVGLLVPGFFGRGPSAHWGAWDRVEVGYAGVLSLLLATLALLAGREPAGRPGEAEPGDETALPDSYRFASLAAFGLLLAMGGYTVVHGWLYGLVPGLGGMRAPARAVFLLDFGLAALAAMGLDVLLRKVDGGMRPALGRMLRGTAWVIGALALVAVPLAYYALLTSQDKDPVIFARTAAAVNGLVFFTALLAAGAGLLYLRYRERLRPAAFGALAAGLLFFDLASLGSNVDVGYQDPSRGFDHPDIVRFLKSDPGLYRIDSRTDVWHLWQPNTSLLHGIFDVGGLINPLSLADYDRYWNAIPSRSSPLYDFLNAKYVIAGKDVALDWEKFVPVFDADPGLNVYLNTHALPRALLVHHAIAVPDHAAALAAVQDPDFDPAASVIVEGGEALELAPAGPAAIRFEAFEADRVRLRVEAPAEAYLVLSEVWYPGWRATVDGAPAPVLRANYAFRAVRLGPGEHVVELAFAPGSWRAGLAVGGLTLLGLAAWGLVSGRRGGPGPSRR